MVLKSIVLGLLQDTNNSVGFQWILEILELLWCHLHWIKIGMNQKFFAPSLIFNVLIFV